MPEIKEKIKKFWIEHELKIILAIGLILIASVSFESGYLKGKTAQNSSIVVEKPAEGQNLSPEAASGSPVAAQNSAQETKISADGSNIPHQNCAYVGSKNSNKYHLPTSRCAKQIKPENVVCFTSADDATAKGYQAGCIK